MLSKKQWFTRELNLETYYHRFPFFLLKFSLCSRHVTKLDWRGPQVTSIFSFLVVLSDSLAWDPTVSCPFYNHSIQATFAFWKASQRRRELLCLRLAS